MFLSNRDIQWAIKTGRLIVRPTPEEVGAGYDPTSIDLHLDHVREAKVWDVAALRESEEARGSHAPEVLIGQFNYAQFASRYLIPPPENGEGGPDTLVFRRGPQVVIKPGGFLLWQTKEEVGTPEGPGDLICFVDGKSTRARTGVLVHLTAPTIHAAWSGKVVLEIVNLGPFHFVLQENDVIAQLTVATISSVHDPTLRKAESATAGQMHVSEQRSAGRKRSRGQGRRGRSS